MSAPTLDLIGHRYAARTGDKLDHLLTRTWVESAGKVGRPAACGMRRQKWRAVHLFDDPSAYRACPDCDRAAGIETADPKPLDTAPVAKRGRTIVDLHPGVRVPAEPVEPQLAHAAIPSSHRITRGAYLTSIPQPDPWVAW